MNTSIFIIFLLGILGVFAHCLCKLIKLNKDASNGNVPFNWYKDYVYSDRFSIMLSFLSVVVWYFIYNEVEGAYSQISAWKITSFFVVGFFGSYAIQYGKSKGEKRIRKVIDEKTDIADGKKS